MKTKLSNIVRYQHKKFDGLTDPMGLDTIRQAFIKLKPLEDEINQHPDADIDFMASGNIMVTGMPDKLLKEVSDLLRS